MKYFCNPLNLPYKYQLIKQDGKITASREAADPSVVLFNGRYFLFPSMTAGFYVSDDLITWALYDFNQEMPIYDYAPDVRVVGEYLYFSASKLYDKCKFFRTKDPINGMFEELDEAFPFWDPNLFFDDDGRLYFFWGCSNVTPI